MNIEEIRDYCMMKSHASESFPFDKTTLVFKVHNKMFALIDIEDKQFINLKCEPERAIQLREEFTEITPGYHMNKVHWNSVSITSLLSDKFIMELIDDSYELIFTSLPKKLRE